MYLDAVAMSSSHARPWTWLRKGTMFPQMASCSTRAASPPLSPEAMAKRMVKLSVACTGVSSSSFSKGPAGKVKPQDIFPDYKYPTVRLDGLWHGARCGSLVVISPFGPDMLGAKVNSSVVRGSVSPTVNLLVLSREYGTTLYRDCIPLFPTTVTTRKLILNSVDPSPSAVAPPEVELRWHLTTQR